MSAVELATGYVTLTVETSDLGRQVGSMFSGVESTAAKSGRKMGESMAKAFERSKPDIESLEKEVQKAQDKVVAHKERGARKIEAADRKVEIQQAKVNEMLRRYGQDSSQYLRANDQLITAKQKAEAETLEYESALGKLESQLEDTQGALKDAQKATDETGDSASGAADKYSKGWRGVAQRLRDTLTNGVRGASDQAATAAEAGGSKVGSFWSRAMETAVGVGLYKVGSTVASKIGGFVSNAFSSGWDRLTSIDEASAKLRGLGNDADEVELIMQNATDAVTGTAYGLEAAATTAAGAVAAGIKPGEELESMLTSVANSAAASGGTLEEMGAIFNKVATVDMAQMDVLNQVSDRGIPIIASLAEQLGVTTAEVRDMASAGEIGFAEFESAMAHASGTVAEEMGKTFTGSLSLVTSSLSRMGANLWSGVFEMAAPALQALQGRLKGIEPLAQEMGERLGEALQNAVQWISENTDKLKTFGSVVATVAAGLGAYFAITKTIAAFGALRAWIVNTTVAQRGLNAVLRANPIGAVITAITALVAGFIWAYREIGWFKDGVDTVLDALATGWDWLYTNAIQPAIDGIVAGWHWMVGAIAAAWENVLKPVWEAIATVAQWLWESVLVSVFTAIWVAWQGVMLAMKAAWEFILKPAWNAISTVAMWLWNSVLSPVFTWIGDHWHLILLGMKLYWETVLKPVWDAIAAVARWLWNSVLSPIFGWIGDTWSNILAGMGWAWNNILKPTWDTLASVAQRLWDSVLSPIFGWIGDKWDSVLKGMEIVWESVLKPAFEKFGEIVTDLRDKFETAVDNIKKAWDKIKSVAAKPIIFVIERVINDGLIDGFNTLTGWIPGVDELSPVPVPGPLKKYNTGFATGGYTGPGGKNEPAGVVHKDEFVLRKEATQKLRAQVGLAGLDYMNKYGQFPGYSGGGLVQPVRGRFTSGFGASRGRYPHAGVDWAVPVGTPVKAALAGTVARAGWNVVTGRTGIGVFLSHPGHRNTYYGHLSRASVSPGQQVSKGQVIGLSGNTGRSTGPHLHFETWTGGKPVDPMKYMGGLPASDSGGEGGGGFNPLRPLLDLVDGIAGKVKNAFAAGGIFVDAAAGFGRKVVGSIIDWAKSKLDFFGDPDDSDAGSGPVQDQVRDVAARYGWDSGGQWLALSKIIQKESGWNLNAANPRSSARGLFQKMTSIHGPVEKTAAGQAEWGLKYIKGRYGTPSSALAFHERRGYYADGGLVRDSGGVIPPGSSVVHNWTRDPEWVYTDKQQDTVQDALDITKRGAGKQLHVHLNGDGVSVSDVFRKFEFEDRREARKAGV